MVVSNVVVSNAEKCGEQQPTHSLENGGPK